MKSENILFDYLARSLIFFRFQFPDEGSGCIRTIASTSTSHLFIGTTRNTIWSGTLDNGFQRIQQVHFRFSHKESDLCFQQYFL